MDDTLRKLQSFFKGLDVEKAQTVRDPMAIATYVKTRYGVPDKSVFHIARGVAGKSKARQWNKTHKGTDETHKTGKYSTKKKYDEKNTYRDYKDKPSDSGAGREYAGVPKGHQVAGRKTKRAVAKRTPRKRPAGVQRRLPGMKAIEKAESIKDTRKLAHHLSSGGARGSHGKANPDHSWKTWEGGMRGKANAKDWNQIENPDRRGYHYDSTGWRRNKEEHEANEKAKKEKKQQRAADTRAKRAGQPKQLEFPKKIMGKKGKSMTKMFDVLLKAKKFGGKPLGWDELPRDPISFATNVMQDKGFVNTNLSANTKGANTRNKLAQDIRALINEIPDASKKEIKSGKRNDDKWEKEAKKEAEDQRESWKNGTPEDDVNLKKQPLPPALARLLGFGAGWAMSDTFVEAPRGQMTPSQQRAWERLVRSSMRRKKGLQKDAIDSLKTHYSDSSDTYVRKIPIQNSLNIVKDHAPVPPRAGLVWDEQKKHWTRQEHVGHTVAEVQGKKRVRGSGTGVHEHTRAAGGVGGKGAGMSAQAGRRFRSVADVGVVKPHEARHPSTTKTKARKNIIQRVLARRGHKTTH